MFKSRARAINVPQYEHGRLAGVLAAHWGNDAFDRPALHWPGFVQGVTLHDWHYGPIDNLPILEMDEAAWLEVVQRGVAHRFDDPTTDIVAKLHIKRLLGDRVSPAVAALREQIEARVAERLPDSGATRAQFEWADRIMAFCDDVAFHYSFERPRTLTTTLYADVAATVPTTITYIIGPAGTVTVTPWPFGRPSFSGLIVGYERPGYPETLTPRVIPYHFTEK